MREKEGPILQRLTHRLSECPPDFLAEPRIGTKGAVHVDAVVFDLILDLGGQAPGRLALEPFLVLDKKERNRLRLALVACWLFHDPWFIEAGRCGGDVLKFLSQGLFRLAELVNADLFVTDAERREELARLCLWAVGCRPAGESREQAQDRLTSLDSVKRHQVLEATRAQHEAAQRLRKQMKQKEAEEAAAKYNRE